MSVILKIHIIRGSEGQSKGCAFIKFVERESAHLAIHELNESVPEVSNDLLLEWYVYVMTCNDSSCPVHGVVGIHSSLSHQICR